MKIRTGIIGLLLVAGVSSCTKERFTQAELTGYYRQVAVRATTPDGELVYEDKTGNATHLGLREDGFYYNYYTGSWSVEGATLRLTHGSETVPPTWTYTLERLGEDVLLLHRTVPAEESGIFIPGGVSRDVVLYETFHKEN